MTKWTRKIISCPELFILGPYKFFFLFDVKTYPTDNGEYVDATFFAIQPEKNSPVVLGRVCHAIKQDKG